MSLGKELSADTLLFHTNVTNCCKSLVSLAKVYHQQLKEHLLDPNLKKNPVGHGLEYGNCVFWKSHQKQMALKPLEGILPSVPNH